MVSLMPHPSFVSLADAAAAAAACEEKGAVSEEKGVDGGAGPAADAVEYPKDGERVRDAKGHVGTVRYVGSVLTSRNPHQKWIGVEWDEDGRGKHDGMVTDSNERDQRYFECKMGRGSFVRPNKVVRGVSFLSAAYEKYGGEELNTETKTNLNTFETLRGEEVSVELVLNERNNGGCLALKKLETLSLAGDNVRGVMPKGGAKGQLREACPRLSAVNLSSNLIGDWEDVGALGHELPRLVQLDLAKNKMAPLNTLGLAESSLLRGAFMNLEVLILNGTGIKWGEVQALEPCLPNITEVHLCGNGIRILDTPPSSYNNWSAREGDHREGADAGGAREGGVVQGKGTRRGKRPPRGRQRGGRRQA